MAHRILCKACQRLGIELRIRCGLQVPCILSLAPEDTFPAQGFFRERDRFLRFSCCPSFGGIRHTQILMVPAQSPSEVTCCWLWRPQRPLPALLEEDSLAGNSPLQPSDQEF